MLRDLNISTRIAKLSKEKASLISERKDYEKYRSCYEGSISSLLISNKKLLKSLKKRYTSYLILMKKHNGIDTSLNSIVKLEEMREETMKLINNFSADADSKNGVMRSTVQLAKQELRDLYGHLQTIQQQSKYEGTFLNEIETLTKKKIGTQKKNDSIEREVDDLEIIFDDIYPINKDPDGINQKYSKLLDMIQECKRLRKDKADIQNYKNQLNYYYLKNNNIVVDHLSRNNNHKNNKSDIYYKYFNNDCSNANNNNNNTNNTNNSYSNAKKKVKPESVIMAFDIKLNSNASTGSLSSLCEYSSLTEDNNVNSRQTNIIGHIDSTLTEVKQKIESGDSLKEYSNRFEPIDANNRKENKKTSKSFDRKRRKLIQQLSNFSQIKTEQDYNEQINNNSSRTTIKGEKTISNKENKENKLEKPEKLDKNSENTKSSITKTQNSKLSVSSKHKEISKSLSNPKKANLENDIISDKDSKNSKKSRKFQDYKKKQPKNKNNSENEEEEEYDAETETDSEEVDDTLSIKSSVSLSNKKNKISGNKTSSRSSINKKSEKKDAASSSASKQLLSSARRTSSSHSRNHHKNKKSDKKPEVSDFSVISEESSSSTSQKGNLLKLDLSNLKLKKNINNESKDNNDINNNLNNKNNQINDGNIKNVQLLFEESKPTQEKQQRSQHRRSKSTHFQDINISSPPKNGALLSSRKIHNYDSISSIHYRSDSRSHNHYTSRPFRLHQKDNFTSVSFMESSFNDSDSSDFIVEFHNTVSQTEESLRTIAAAILNEELLRFESEDNINDKIHKSQNTLDELELEVVVLNREIMSKKRKHDFWINSFKIDHKLKSFDLNVYHPLKTKSQSIQTNDVLTIEQLKRQIIFNSQQNPKSFLMKQEQRDIFTMLSKRKLELKIIRMTNVRKKLDIDSLLKRLKIVDPILYSAETHEPAQIEVDPQILEKKQHKIDTLASVSQHLIDSSQEGELISSQISDQQFMIDRMTLELQEMAQEPRPDVQLLCESLKEDRAIINENLRQFAFVVLEGDSIEKNISRYRDMLSAKNLKTMQQKVNNLNSYLYQIKNRYNTLRAVKEKRNYIMTCEEEMNSLQREINSVISEVDVYRMRINGVISKIEKQSRSIISQNIRYPEPPGPFHRQERSKNSTAKL